MTWYETGIGGGGESFPETAWSRIARAEGGELDEAALVHLCQAYWRPVYRYVRRTGVPVEDAKDLTQSFVWHLIEGDLPSRYRAEKGSFRAFIKGCLKLYLAQERRRDRALKRGGGRLQLSIDSGPVGRPDWVAGEDQLSPEELFDRQWAADVLTSSLRDLREQLAQEGKQLQLEVYQRYELHEQPSQPTYAEVGGALGLSAHQVKAHLKYVRQRLHGCIVTTLSDCVTSPAELLEEMQELLLG